MAGGAAKRFWVSHVAVPAIAFAILFVSILTFHWDERVASSLFFDARSGNWVGSGAGESWARDLLHTGGRNLVRTVVACALGVWLLAFRVEAVRPYQRSVGYVAISMIIAVAVVGALKAVSNVDCPWDLQGFGGNRPHLGIFGYRPDSLPRAQCFPGAHSASGFALMAFYFALRDRSPRAALYALAGGFLMGCLFSLGQQARGAHFLSHDLASAALVWLTLVLLYVGLLRQPTEQ